MDHATRQQMMSIVTEMMRDPTATVEMFSGVREIKDREKDHIEYEPTGGKTFVLHVKGGANNVQIDRVETVEDMER